MDIFKKIFDLPAREGVSPVQLSYMINQNIVIYSIAIDHLKVQEVWPKYFYDPYVCCLIIPSDTCLLLHSLQQPGKAPFRKPPLKVGHIPLSFVPHCGSDLRLSLETKDLLQPGFPMVLSLWRQSLDLVVFTVLLCSLKHFFYYFVCKFIAKSTYRYNQCKCIHQHVLSFSLSFLLTLFPLRLKIEQERKSWRKTKFWRWVV